MGTKRWQQCKDPSHFLFSGFVYSYLHNPFSSYTVNILNVSYYLTIERDLVQVGLMSKDQVLYIFEQAHFP